MRELRLWAAAAAAPAVAAGVPSWPSCAAERSLHPTGTGYHAGFRVGDSVIKLPDAHGDDQLGHLPRAGLRGSDDEGIAYALALLAVGVTVDTASALRFLPGFPHEVTVNRFAAAWPASTG